MRPKAHWGPLSGLSMESLLGSEGLSRPCDYLAEWA